MVENGVHGPRLQAPIAISTNNASSAFGNIRRASSRPTAFIAALSRLTNTYAQSKATMD